MAPPFHGEIRSGSGSVFIGDGNAGRDIVNIYTIAPIARDLRNSLMVSSEQFRPVQKQLETLIGALQCIAENNEELEIDLAEEPKLHDLLTDCNSTLSHLQDLKRHFDSVGLQTQSVWEREQWRTDELVEIKKRLKSIVASLNDVNRTLVQSSVKRIEELLETFIDEVRTGRREGSVVTQHTFDSLSTDEKEAWRLLRKELESIGITPKLFNEHHDRILKRLEKAIKDGDLVEDSEELSMRSHESSMESLAAANTGDDASDDPKAALTTMNPGSEARPEASLSRPPESATGQSTARPIKKPSRIVNLIHRIAYGSMYDAARRNNVSSVRELLQSRVSPNATGGRHEQTPLAVASAAGYTDVIQLLLESGKINTEARDNGGWTPLMLAAHYGHTDAMKMLIQLGKADIEAKHPNGWTPLMLAAHYGHTDAIKMLIQLGKADIEAKNRIEETPLILAARYGHTDAVKMLIQLGKANVELSTRWEETALYIAATRGHDAVVKALIELGNANVDETQLYGNTPLISATRHVHEKVVVMLVELGGADILVRDDSQKTALHHALYNGNSGRAIAKYLKSALRQQGKELPPDLP